jgi:hypothetical protein
MITARFKCSFQAHREFELSWLAFSGVLGKEEYEKKTERGRGCGLAGPTIDLRDGLMLLMHCHKAHGQSEVKFGS